MEALSVQPLVVKLTLNYDIKMPLHRFLVPPGQHKTLFTKLRRKFTSLPGLI